MRKSSLENKNGEYSFKALSAFIVQACNSSMRWLDNHPVTMPTFSFKETYYNENDSVYPSFVQYVTLPDGKPNTNAIKDILEGRCDEFAYNIVDLNMSQRWEDELARKRIPYMASAIVEVTDPGQNGKNTKGQVSCIYLYRGKDLMKANKCLDKMENAQSKLSVRELVENNKNGSIDCIKNISIEEYDEMKKRISFPYSITVSEENQSVDLYFPEEARDEAAVLRKEAFIVTTGKTYDTVHQLEKDKNNNIAVAVKLGMDSKNNLILYNEANPNEYLLTGKNGFQYFITSEIDGEKSNIEIAPNSVNREDMDNEEYETRLFDALSRFSNVKILDASEVNLHEKFEKIQQRGGIPDIIDKDAYKIQLYKKQLAPEIIDAIDRQSELKRELDAFPKNHSEAINGIIATDSKGTPTITLRDIANGYAIDSRMNSIKDVSWREFLEKKLNIDCLNLRSANALINGKDGALDYFIAKLEKEPEEIQTTLRKELSTAIRDINVEKEALHVIEHIDKEEIVRDDYSEYVHDPEIVNSIEQYKEMVEQEKDITIE